MTNVDPSSLRVGVVGAGRVGVAMGVALRDAGFRIGGVVARSEASRQRVASRLSGVLAASLEEVISLVDLVLIAVPDDALRPLVEQIGAGQSIRSGQVVAHTSGRAGWRVLDPLVARGVLPIALHPAMTFVGDDDDAGRIAGCCFGVTAPDESLEIALALVARLGAMPVVVDEEARVRYHAALTHGANHLVTLVAQALDVLRAAGVVQADRVLRPLVEAAFENTLAMGDRALSGPVARGDAGTVAAHVGALRDAPLGADVLSTYVAVSAATATRAVADGRLSPDAAQAVLLALTEDPGRRTGG